MQVGICTFATLAYCNLRKIPERRNDHLKLNIEKKVSQNSYSVRRQ